MRQPNDSVRSVSRTPVLLRTAARTHVGLVRTHNEDTWFCADLTNGKRDPSSIPRLGPAGLVLGVCDGMGGAAAGEVASALAAHEVPAQLERAPVKTSRDEFACALVLAIEAADKKIRENVARNPARRGMGTTCTAAAYRNGELLLGQVGDSRAYLYRKGALVQVTKDQSYVRHLVELGEMTPEEARVAPNANVIMQSLGGKEQVQVELSVVPVRRGDRLLVCSDGLTGMVRDEVIQSMLACFSEVEEACDRLIALANEGGGRDNVTVVLCEFGGDSLPEAAPDEVLAYQPFVLDAATRLASQGAGELDAPVVIPGLHKRRYLALVALAILLLGVLGYRGMERRVRAGVPRPARATQARDASSDSRRLPLPTVSPPETQSPPSVVQNVEPEPEAAETKTDKSAHRPTLPKPRSREQQQLQPTAPKKWNEPTSKAGDPF